jgi:hypothetical protein
MKLIITKPDGRNQTINNFIQQMKKEDWNRQTTKTIPRGIK